MAPDFLKVVDETLRTSENCHRASFTRAPVPMLILDVRAVVTEVSDRCLDLLGCSRHQVVGRSIVEFQEPQSAQLTAAEWRELLRRGEVREVERCFCRRDGALLAVLLSATVERAPGGGELRVIVALTDITGRKQTEAALRASEEGLRHAQKMETMGHLSGSIAHDFNNVLQAVTSNLELILGRTETDRAEVMRLADNALDAARTGAAITSQLLTFARSQQFDLKPLDPIEIVNRLHPLLAMAAGERIALQIDAPVQGVGACLADLNQLECALLNLVINARDAIGGSAGTITISLCSEDVETAAEDGLLDGGTIRFAVRDDGPGMSEEVRSRAFDPFFTTKAAGKGTGLGLAQVCNFAQQCGGMAVIESMPGRGTEVAMLLPCTDTPLRQIAVPVLPPAEAEAGRGETVLIVEDDAMVRSTLAETLFDLGYRIIEAQDADAALAVLDGGVAADLILTDLFMPGSMDGLEFATVARSRFPELPVILTTGHIDILSSKRVPHDVEVLSKPYTRGNIATAARHALARNEH